jgi:hypothetical protein
LLAELLPEFNHDDDDCLVRIRKLGIPFFRNRLCRTCGGLTGAIGVVRTSNGCLDLAHVYKTLKSFTPGPLRWSMLGDVVVVTVPVVVVVVVVLAARVIVFFVFCFLQVGGGGFGGFTVVAGRATDRVVRVPEVCDWAVVCCCSVGGREQRWSIAPVATATLVGT